MDGATGDATSTLSYDYPPVPKPLAHWTMGKEREETQFPVRVRWEQNTVQMDLVVTVVLLANRNITPGPR